VSVREHQRAAPPGFPPGVDGRRLLMATQHSAWRHEGLAGARYRRRETRHSPLMFAVTYLGHRLRQQDTGLMSFAQFHLDLAEAAARWADPVPARDAWVGPRGLGKTEWLFLALPLWAISHGHRRFFLAVSYSRDQAIGHLANLRMEIDENGLLRHDFPELEPKRVRGARNTATTVVASGATIAARGLGETALGIRVGTARPDLIVGDDLEPSETNYGPEAKVKLQRKLTDGVLPMGARHAVVQLTGTVTMRGSMIHDVVRTAKGEAFTGGEWVQQKGFTPRYYPPINPDGSTVWAQRWTAEELRAQEDADPREYGLNMRNDPHATDDISWWTPDLFTYDQRFPTVARVIHLDVATTRNRGSDFTVLAQVGRDASGLRACVERVEWGQWDLDETRNKIHDFCAPLRRLPLVQVEGNQGGDTWLRSLAPWPEGVEYKVVHARGNKERVRIARAHNHYKRRAVVHAYPMPELEAELCSWPRARHDDVPDAVAGALAWAFPAA
jgi:hypothetical protein